MMHRIARIIYGTLVDGENVLAKHTVALSARCNDHDDGDIFIRERAMASFVIVVFVATRRLADRDP
jgi:hypothetical protein